MISDRALNRALLDRQFLLARVSRPALSVLEHLLGMQAQEPADPYVGLWTRLAGFDRGSWPRPWRRARRCGWRCSACSSRRPRSRTWCSAGEPQ